jgi:hypothetical protein
MENIFSIGVAYLWTALWIAWLVSALMAKRSVQRQTIASRLEQFHPGHHGVLFTFCPRSLASLAAPESLA